MILMFVQLFKDATAFFSCATPYLAKVIPAMNHIDQHLATAACNNAYKPCIQATVTMGKKLLNKYYSYTYHSELYWIAMGGFPSLVEYWFNVIFVVLHPSHKLTYFTKLDGTMRWWMAHDCWRHCAGRIWVGVCRSWSHGFAKYTKCK